MLLDALIIATPIVFVVLWLWPDSVPDDTYDNPDHWGDQ